MVSVATTTGYASTGFAAWPTFLPLLLFMASFMGGCAGSAAGGMKVIRIMLIFKQGLRELRRLVHPNAIFTIKLGGKPVDSRIGEAVWGFFAAYVFLYAVMFLVLLSLELDIATAFSTVASCLNNLGPALGSAAGNYQSLPDAAKWILCFAMLLGRLEIFYIAGVVYTNFLALLISIKKAAFQFRKAAFLLPRLNSVRKKWVLQSLFWGEPEAG